MSIDLLNLLAHVEAPVRAAISHDEGWRFYLDYFLHLDENLKYVTAQQRGWTYLLLAVTLFLETGVLVLPFLPGDSLLFFVGAICAKGVLNPLLSFSLLSLGAIVGDSVAFALGCWFRDHIAAGKRVHLVNPRHLEKTRGFFQKHGAQAVIFARFVPVVRAFSPFAAGIAGMQYAQFIKYSIVGATLWVGGFVSLGYWLGRFEFVSKNFKWFALAVVLMTVFAVVAEILRSMREDRKTALAERGRPGPLIPPEPGAEPSGLHVGVQGGVQVELLPSPTAGAETEAPAKAIGGGAQGAR